MFSINQIKKFRCIAVLIFCFISFQLFSQNNNENVSTKGFDISKIYTGGGIGLTFGTVTIIDVSPIIGYRFTEKLSVGIGGIYKYYNDKQFTHPDKRTIFGGSAFSKYYVTENIFAHVEYEYITYKTDFYSYFHNEEQVSEWGLLAGGGYRQKLANKTYVYAMILYNFNETQYPPYENPVIRVGVELGL